MILFPRHRGFCAFAKHPLYGKLVGYISDISKAGQIPNLPPQVPMEISIYRPIERGSDREKEEMVLKEFKCDWEGKVWVLIIEAED